MKFTINDLDTLVLTKICKDMLVEFDLKVETNASSAFLLSFNLSQPNLEKQLLLFIQQQNENLLKMQ